PRRARGGGAKARRREDQRHGNASRRRRRGAVRGASLSCATRREAGGRGPRGVGREAGGLSPQAGWAVARSDGRSLTTRSPAAFARPSSKGASSAGLLDVGRRGVRIHMVPGMLWVSRGNG